MKQLTLELFPPIAEIERKFPRGRDCQRELLAIALDLSVALNVAEIRKCSRWCTWQEILEKERPRLIKAISNQGDIILYRSQKSRETAYAFNCLARAIALMSFAPGGVTCFDNHWENCFDKKI